MNDFDKIMKELDENDLDFLRVSDLDKTNNPDAKDIKQFIKKYLNK